MRHPSLIALSHDHHHGLALALRCRKQALGQTKPLGMAGLKERAAEFREFFPRALERHFQAEEEILFPLMRSIAGGDSLVENLVQEHGRLREMAARLENAADLSKSLFDAGDLLERHIRREERELFPLFEKHVSESEAERIKREIAAILERPSPSR
jgi:hemerythrin-like domain-containing protein